MIKLLSFKTKRPDLGLDEFRRYYEGHHVPLGLSFIEHFRWRKYRRNYVVETLFGSVDFQCLTEFWIANEEDQAHGARFVQSPKFAVLEQDDERFLDTSKRLSFAVDEHILHEAPGNTGNTYRLAMFISKPPAIKLLDFNASISHSAKEFCASQLAGSNRVSLDLCSNDDGVANVYAVLSICPENIDTPEKSDWPEFEYPGSIVKLENVESPHQQLFKPA